MPISLGIGTAVTRGGGLSWSPLSISGLQFWVDAADSATLYTDSALTTLAVSDGDVVGGWKDKSPSACNLTQTDGTKKPLLKLAVQNSKNAIRWDSVNDSLGNTTSSVVGDDFTLFITKSTSSLVSQAAFKSSTRGRSFFFDQKDGGGIYDYHGYGGVLEPNARYNATSAGTTLIQTLIISSGFISTFHKNGLQQTSNGGNPHGILTNNNSLDFLGCDLYEILVYNSALSSIDRANVETYLNGKWGIY